MDDRRRSSLISLWCFFLHFSIYSGYTLAIWSKRERKRIDAHLRKYVLHYFDENSGRNPTERSRLHIVIATTCELINSRTEIRSPVDWFGTPGIRVYLELARKPDRGYRQGGRASEGSLLQQFHRCSCRCSPMLLDVSWCLSMLLSTFPDAPWNSFCDTKWHSRDKRCEINEICTMIRSKGNELMIAKYDEYWYARKLWTNYYVYTWKYNRLLLNLSH